MLLISEAFESMWRHSCGIRKNANRTICATTVREKAKLGIDLFKNEDIK